MNTNGKVIYEGPSLLDGSAPIVVIVTGLTVRTANGKTGNMLQTWILCKHSHPMEALRNGSDSAICGDCPLRGIAGKERPCYVQVFRAPAEIWKAYQRGSYGRMHPSEVPVNGRALRIGSYGDPAAVPVTVWEDLADNAGTVTGYTHQWRKADPRLAGLCMASVESAESALVAEKWGWRYFRARTADSPLAKNEFICPASGEGGQKTNCADCGLCSGRRNARLKRHPVIIAHGAGKKHFQEALLV